MKIYYLFIITSLCLCGCKKKNVSPSTKSLVSFANIKRQNGSNFDSHIIYKIGYRTNSNEVTKVSFVDYGGNPVEYVFSYKNDLVEKIDVYNPILKKSSEAYLFKYNSEKQLILVEVKNVNRPDLDFFWSIAYKNNQINKITYLTSINSTDQRYNYVFEYDTMGKVNNVIINLPTGIVFPKLRIDLKYSNDKLINPFAEPKNLWIAGFIGSNPASEHGIFDNILSTVITFKSQYCPTQITSKFLEEFNQDFLSNVSYKTEDSGRIIARASDTFETTNGQNNDLGLFFNYQFNYDFK